MTQPPERPWPPSPQPWYGPPETPAAPSPGNAHTGPGPAAGPLPAIGPHAAAETTVSPPGGGPRRRLSRGVFATFVAGAAALALLSTAAVYALTTGDGDDGKPSAHSSSGPPSPAPSTPPKGSPPPDPDKGRTPDQAHAWAAWNPKGKLPGRGTYSDDMWIMGKTVVQAWYKEVVGYRLSDGKRLWSVPLSGEVCDTPVNLSSDSKLVVAHTNGKVGQSLRCNQLQMIDLRTRKAVWEKALPDAGGPSQVRLAIADGVVAVTDDISAQAFRVRDGERLFTTGTDGYCTPDDLASSGDRLLQVDYCTSSTQRFWGGLRELDPRTGRTLWSYRSAGDWQVLKVLSVSPLVLLEAEALHMENWRTVVVDKNHKKARTLPELQRLITKYKFKPCRDRGVAGGAQNCSGTVTDGATLALSHEGMAAAFDLRTGKRIWGKQQNDGGTLIPVSVKDDKAVVYETAVKSRNGRLVELGRDADRRTDPKVLVEHPEAARGIESRPAGGVLRHEGQLLVSPLLLHANSGLREARILSFKAP